MNSNVDIPKVLSTAEAAAALGLKPGTLREWSAYERGPIQPVRINNGRLRWNAEDIAKVLRGEL